MFYDDFEKYLYRQSKKSIIRIYKTLNLKNYGKYSKIVLISLIIKTLAIKKIQRWYRKILSKGDPCNITLDSLEYPCWGKKLVNEHNYQVRFYYFNLEPIVHYILENGIEYSKCPISGQSFTTQEIDTLDQLYKYEKYHKIFKVKNFKKFINRTKYFQNKKIKEEQIDIQISMIRHQSIKVKNLIEYYNKVVLENEKHQKMLIIKTQFDIIRGFIHRLYNMDIDWAQKVFKMIETIIDTGLDNEFITMVRKFIIIDKMFLFANH